MSSISGISGYTNYAYYQNVTGTQNNRGQGDLFKKLDTDSSGGISKTELDTFVKKISENSGTTISTDDAITTYDTDGDGELSSTELKSFLDANRPKQPPMPPMGMMGMQGGPSPEEMFKSLDTDSSGGLSQTELDTLAEKISTDTGQSIDTTDAITTYDTDGDGELSMDEVQSFLDASGIRPPGPQGMGMQGTSLSSDALSSISDDLLSTYDSDGSGTLDSSELLSLLNSSDISFSSDFIKKVLSAYTTGGSGSDTDSSLSIQI